MNCLLNLDHAVEASIAHSVNEVSRVLDTKMSEFEQRLEKQIGRAASVALVANSAAAAAGGPGVATAPSIDPLQQHVHPQHVPPQQPYTYYAPVPAVMTAPPPSASTSFPVASESLVFLTMAKADTAEKAAAELRAEFSVGSHPYICPIAHPYICPIAHVTDRPSYILHRSPSPSIIYRVRGSFRVKVQQQSLTLA